MADLSPGSFAIVTTLTDPLSLRSAPVVSSPKYGDGSNVIGQLPRGSMVRITGPVIGGFFPVTDVKFGNGFAGATFLTAAPASVAPAPEPAAEAPPAVAPAAVDPVLIDLLETLPVEPDLGQPAPELDDGAAKKKKMMIIGGAVLVAGAIALAASSANKPKASGKRARA